MCRGTSPARSPPPPVGEKPKSTSHRGPDPQQRIRCEKLEGHGTTFTVRPRPHRAYPEAAVDRSPERRIGELSERFYFGSTTTGRSPAQSGGRERLFEMGRRQSAQNARRFSPRRQPAERNRCPSCRHARGRGEPLLWPEVVGAARSSRHPEKPCLCCEGVSRLRPDSILQSWHLSVHQRAMDAVAEAEIRLGKGQFTRTRASPNVATAASEASSRVA